MQDKLYISFLSGTDTLVIRKDKNSNVFILTGDSIIVNRDTFLTILNYMIKNNFVDIKSIEGIIEEYNTE